MTQSKFKEKYSINSLVIGKDETTFTSAKEIEASLKAKIDAHPVAKYIATFDNFEHTSNVNGEIHDEINSAIALIFCFGKAIPTPKMLAIRPRTFGICELEDSFSIDFMDAPADDLTNIMITWAKELKNK
jgi:hypothetical protein